MFLGLRSLATLAFQGYAKTKLKVLIHSQQNLTIKRILNECSADVQEVVPKILYIGTFKVQGGRISIVIPAVVELQVHKSGNRSVDLMETEAR